jgi:hypothetical protein
MRLAKRPGLPAQNVGKHRSALLQLLVNPLELVRTLQLIRRDSKTGEHENQKQAMPKLQPPADRMEKHN